MQDLLTKTVRDIAIESPLTTRVFASHKIDFCCGGRVPVAEACQKAGVDPATVVAELEELLDRSADETAGTAERMKPTELVEHIIATHHAFTRTEVTRLIPLAEKVANRHGETHPELIQIRDIFQQMGEELLVHMRKEEAMLFPYIQRLAIAAERGLPAPMAPFGSVENPVRMMMFEHDQAGEQLRQIRDLSSDYLVPDGACPSYSGLYAGLEALEQDLHQHIHLENNVLFPESIRLEGRLCEVPLGQGA